MDHRLRSEWAHLRGHRRSAIWIRPRVTVRGTAGRLGGKQALVVQPASKPDIQLGYRDQPAACLAELFARGSTESRLPNHDRDNFLLGRRSAEPCLAPETEQNL